MKSSKTVARRLAMALTGRRLSEHEIIKRSTAVLGRRWRWLMPLAKRMLTRFGSGSRPLRVELTRFLLADSRFQQACFKHSVDAALELHRIPAMSPAPGPARQWKVPSIRTRGELACLLNLSAGELCWFVDQRSQEQHLPAGPLRHYRYRWRKKRDGTARLLEAPKQRLKGIQRWIADAILSHIPPHPSAHGFRAGHSILSFVRPHVGRAIVLRVDIKDFFPSIFKARSIAIFMTAGYPEGVARALTGLCVNTAPGDVLRDCPPSLSPAERHRMEDLYRRAHLPQGAPTSPALANLAAYRLDCRLAGLAKAAGGHYTRYADDLVFSGDENFAAGIERFHIHVCAIALEEGFEVNTRKTRIMRQAVAQRAAGLVLNDRANITRQTYDELKAILHNCLRYGPVSQNREVRADFRAHLAGRIAHVELVHPAHGEKLRATFNQIVWGSI